jgi:hypothetical protein
MKPKCTEADMQDALHAIANSMSQKKAGLEYGIPRGILQDRINSRISRQEAHLPQQRLSTVQEERLTQWILIQESLGLAPTHG